MENETKTEEPEPTPENQKLTVVYIGEIAVWMTVVEFYAHHNR